MNWQQLRQFDVEATIAWAEDQTWVHAMAACEQDAEWHAEGDVWTHTKMVCRQLPLLDNWHTLTEDEQTILLFVALLHDSAKPLTSRLDEKTGRITSPKHAVKGELLARGVLRDLECDISTREKICQLIRYHGRPVFLVHRKQPEREVVKLSWLVNNKHLSMFAFADARGRHRHSTDRKEEDLHFWKLHADEVDCYDKPYGFSNDHARFLFYRTQEPNLHYVPHEEFRCSVTMMSGLPGAGKDTWLREHRSDLPVVSLDAIRADLQTGPTDNQGKVLQAARNRCREYLRAGQSFAFNATNIIQMTRKRWVDMFCDYSARIEMVHVEPPFRTIIAQNRSRDSPVPERVIRDLAAKNEPPNWTECHQLIRTEAE